MKQTRKFKQIGFQLFLLVFIGVFLCVSIPLAAQEDEDKGETFRGGIRLEGELHCQKPDPDYSIPVPDREGHVLMLSRRQCTWTKPLVVAGSKTKNGPAIHFAEQMEGRLHVHGFETYSVDNGDKLTTAVMGQVIGEKGPAEDRGRWSFKKGTGKFRGIRGGGEYTGKLQADGALTLSFKGVYLPESFGEKNEDEKK